MFINLTPHALVILGDLGDKSPMTLAPSGAIARVAVTREYQDPINGIPVTRATFGAIEGLPAPILGTWYIVSAVVASAARRADVLSPGELVRGPDGQPIGCRGLTATV